MLEHLSLLFFFLRFIRAHESVRAVGGAEGEGERISSNLSAEQETQHRAWSHNPEIRTWAETKNWSPNQLHHPGTPVLHCFLIILHCMNRPHFIYPSFNVSSSFSHMLTVTNNAAMNISIVFVVDIYIHFFRVYIHKSRISGSYGNSVLNHLRKISRLLPKQLEYCGFHHQHIRISVSPHPCQHLLLSLLL